MSGFVFWRGLARCSKPNGRYGTGPEHVVRVGEGLLAHRLPRFETNRLCCYATVALRSVVMSYCRDTAQGGLGMDPITLIVTALAAGAASGVSDTASSAVTDAYANLRALV